jgi:hypothetical protein
MRINPGKKGKNPDKVGLTARPYDRTTARIHSLVTAEEYLIPANFVYLH